MFFTEILITFMKWFASLEKNDFQQVLPATFSLSHLITKFLTTQQHLGLFILNNLLYHFCKRVSHVIMYINISYMEQLSTVIPLKMQSVNNTYHTRNGVNRTKYLKQSERTRINGREKMWKYIPLSVGKQS